MDRRAYHRQRMARRGLDEQTVKRDKDYINRVLKDSETMESINLARAVGLPEERHGTISAPTNPRMAEAGMALGAMGRALEGHPLEMFIPGPASANWASKVGYGEQPDGWDRLGAVADAADVIPGLGTALGAAAMIPRKGASKSKRRVGTTGKYVGAPSDVDSPQKLAEMRRQYMQQMEAGTAGRDWYHDASPWIDSVSPDGMRQGVADTLGISSQGTGVDTNLGFTAKGVNQRASGDPIRTGRFPGDQSPLIEKALEGERVPLGPKRQPFADNLSVGWNPEMAQHPVHDIWQGRAFGYKHPDGKPWDAGFSPQQHSFMDEETAAIIERANKARLGGHDNWDPMRAQAGAWTGAKIRAENLSPEDAAKHYGDFSHKYQASATHEQVPGAGLGHLEGLLDEPLAVREAYSSQAGWRNERGLDDIYSSGGLMVEPSLPGRGVYTPKGSDKTEFNPLDVGRPLVTTAEPVKAGRGGQIRPNEAGLLDTGESSRAYVDAQNAGAWHKIIPENQTVAGERTSVLVTAKDLTEEQMRALDALAKRHGMFAVDGGDGVRFVNDEWSEIGGVRAKSVDKKGNPDGGVKLGKELAGDFGREIHEVVGPVPFTRAKIQTGYQDYQDLWAAGEGSGQATRKFLADLEGNAHFAENIEPALRRKAALNIQRDQAMAAERGWPIREDIQRARQILVDGGREALQKALDSGAILPAAVAAVLSPALLQSDDETEPDYSLL